jgi:hypothetical protein
MLLAQLHQIEVAEMHHLTLLSLAISPQVIEFKCEFFGMAIAL